MGYECWSTNIRCNMNRFLNLWRKIVTSDTIRFEFRYSLASSQCQMLCWKTAISSAWNKFYFCGHFCWPQGSIQVLSWNFWTSHSTFWCYGCWFSTWSMVPERSRSRITLCKNWNSTTPNYCRHDAMCEQERLIKLQLVTVCRRN